jgi:hypothetical protein
MAIGTRLAMPGE